MKRLAKKIIAGAISLSIIGSSYGACIRLDAQAFGVIPVKAAENTLTVNYSKIDKTVTDILKGMSDIIKTDEQHALLNAFGKLGGVSTLAGGGIAILEMTGIIKDPTAQKLATIQNTLNIVLNQVNDINTQIHNVQQTLHDMQSKTLIKDRNKEAVEAMTRWESICQGQLQNLENKKQVYKDMVFSAIDAWTNSSSKSDLTCYLNNQYEQVWAKNGASIDGQTIKYTITLPQSVVAQFVPVETLQQDSYADSLINQLKDAIYDAAERGVDESTKETYEKKQTKLDEEIKQFKEDYDSEYTDIVTKYEKLGDDLSDINKQLNEIPTQRTDLNTQQEAKKTELSGINVQVDVDTANNAVNQAQAVVDGYNNAISTYENTAEDQRTEEMKAAYNEAQANLQNAQNTLNKALEDQTNAQRKVQLESEIKELDSQIKDLDTNEKDLNEKFDKTNTEKEDLQEKYEKAKKITDEQKEIDDKLAELEARDHSAPEKLDASKYFYKLWKDSTDDEKKEKAEKIATAMVNNFIYNKSCEAMSCSEGRAFLTSFRQAYDKACNDVIKSDTLGMKNFWNILTNTYTFEGQVTDIFNNTMNFLIRSLGLTGSFLVSMEAQDNSVSEAMIQSDVEKWENAVEELQNYKDTRLTGYKNYCFLTNTVLKYNTVTVGQNVTFKTRYYDDERFKYNDMSTTDMTVTINDENNEGKNLNDKTSVSDDILGALAILSQGNPEQFLRDNGVIDANTKFTSEIAFEVGNSKDLKVSEQVNSTCYQAGEKYHGNWFTDGKVYEYLDRQDYGGWSTHVKLTGSTVDLANNQLSKDKMLATFLTFTRRQKGNNPDEVYLFTNMNQTNTIDKKWDAEDDDNNKAHYCEQTYHCSKDYGFIESVKI